MCETQRRLLRYVGNLPPPSLSLADGVGHLVALSVVNDADLFDARIDSRLDGIMQNGFVGDRNEMFVLGMGEGAEPGAPATAGDERFHNACTFFGGYDLMNCFSSSTVLRYS